MYSYRVMMLGPRGSGKTVYLGSMFQELSIQGEWGFFLGTDNKPRKKLNEIYTQIVTGKKWPAQTQAQDDAEDWVFTCSIIRNSKIFDACQFVYNDYAGGRITESAMEDESDFNQKLESADILLGILDGSKICALMRDEDEGEDWVYKDLKNMLDIMMKKGEKPIHFIISKWDIVESSQYTLREVKEKLLGKRAFKNIVAIRKQDSAITRLIPVSSVGQGFAKLLPDGTMEKIRGKEPEPFQVEVPLACILPDLIQSKQEELAQRRSQETERSTTVTADLSRNEKISQKLPGWLRKVPGIKRIAGTAEEKKRTAEERSDELRRQKDEALNRIEDERSALESVLNSFILIQNRLYANFPDSDLS